MPRRKILFFINPVSGTKNKRPLEKKIVVACLENHLAFEILPTSADRDYSFLKKKIAADNITDVVICGGDGTISPVVSELLGSRIHVGIIPMGSGNGLAFAAGIPRNISQALEIVVRDKTRKTDVFYIDGRLSCMLCGIGLDAQVAQDFSLQKKRGLVTYVKQTFRNFLSAKTYLFELSNDKVNFKAEAFFMCIANSNQFGNNFTIAPKAKLDDGLLDIILVKKMSKPSVVWSVFKQIKGGRLTGYEEKNFHNKSVVYFQTDRLQIINRQLAPLHIDGDVDATRKIFNVEILPAAFRLIVP